MRAFDFVIYQTQGYRRSVDNGQQPTEVWALHEREWYCALWEIPENEPQAIERILRNVDSSIKEYILYMNVAGFATTESCSGFKKDHEDRRLFNPFVMFDDEYYLDVSARVFTLADASGWEPSFGAHGYDVMVEVYDEGDAVIQKAWDLLAEKAVAFGEFLHEYRDLVDPIRGFLFSLKRHQRGLFSRHYSEIERVLTDLGASLDELEKK